MEFEKTGEVCLLSHLELVRVFERALRRAGLPVAYSEGFNPRPRLSFASPLPVGVSGLREYLEVELNEDLPAEYFKALLQKELPSGLKLKGVARKDSPARLAGRVKRARYRIEVPLASPGEENRFWQLWGSFWRQPELRVERAAGKGRKRTVDIKKLVFDLAAKVDRGKVILDLEVSAEPGSYVRPSEIIHLLAQHGLPVIEEEACICREAIFFEEVDSWSG